MLFETPTNPTLDVLDIATITAHAHAVGALVVVDNTFATQVGSLAVIRLICRPPGACSG